MGGVSIRDSKRGVRQIPVASRRAQASGGGRTRRFRSRLLWPEIVVLWHGLPTIGLNTIGGPVVLAPEGRRLIARGANPWTAAFSRIRFSPGRATVPSPFQG